MALRLCSYLPAHVYDRLTEEARADFDNSLQALLSSRPEEPVGPGCERLRQLVWSVTGPIGLGSRTANLMRLMSLREAFGLLSVTALYYVDAWLFNSGHTWEVPAGVMERLAESRGVTVGEYPHCVRLLRDLRDEADQWLVLFVREAIERGHTWADVGEMLGVSRQAAHERYAPLILALARQAVDQETQEVLLRR